MKKPPEKKIGPTLFRSIQRAFNISVLKPVPALVTFLVFLLVVLVMAGSINREGAKSGLVRDIEVGRVADRDIQADEEFSYVDEEATRRRMEAQERLVSAVFRMAPQVENDIIASWSRFTTFASDLFREESSREIFKLKIMAEYPAMVADQVLDAYFTDPARDRYEENGRTILRQIMGAGVFALPAYGLEAYNPDTVELVYDSGSRSEWDRLPYISITTMDSADQAIRDSVEKSLNQSVFSRIAPDLLIPFIRENVFFSEEDTRQRVEEARQRVEPVIKYIEKGKKVIRKGFVITEENMRELRVLNLSRHAGDPRSVLSMALLYILLYGILIFLCSSGILLEKDMNDPELYLLCALTALYLIAAVFLKNLLPEGEYLPVSALLPSALFVMLPALLVSFRIALIFAVFLPLAAYIGGPFDSYSFVFALISGVVATYSLREAEKRMDLVKAALLIAATNTLVMFAVLLGRHAGIGVFPPVLFWAAFNGLASGMLVVGVLPPLEHALNAVTAFRLIELSDLNSPTLKALFTAAPGTYSHSIMVANLAEAACHDIGANPLLARVGAYYHDIGKMDNPSYFVENQTDYNRHDDIAPRLSATVIRSHVKLGVERAQTLGLPQAVIDIIAEHHGNSLITWFYNKAQQQESAEGKGDVDIADFSYPGNPPRSRESAVVMLADVAEAAVRTLQKPTAPKMDKFIQELIAAKVEHGQLAESELTFRDLETIKKAFVRVLAGYYHSRIEYPKPAAPPADSGSPERTEPVKTPSGGPG
ncbi:MAG: HDIG domain-containing protein [Treponema sp.]|nr:HDIG domain-containing protein [Treponema sp.]